MLIIIIALVVLLAAGGAAAFFLMMKDHPPKGDHPGADASTDEGKDAEKSKLPPKFVEIGTFTANLMKEDADSVIQLAVTLKLNKPELEEKVKESIPEIQHKINMLLQSKYRSELATIEGKEKLANEIKAQVEFVLGLRKTAPAIHARVAEGAASQVEPTDASSKVDAPSKDGIADVLFTSLIIQ